MEKNYRVKRGAYLVFSANEFLDLGVLSDVGFTFTTYINYIIPEAQSRLPLIHRWDGDLKDP